MHFAPFVSFVLGPANGTRAAVSLAIPATVALAGISIFEQAFPVDADLQLVLGIR